MSVRGYVLVETEVGRAQAVGRALHELPSDLARMLAIDVITGPFDIIVRWRRTTSIGSANASPKRCSTSMGCTTRPPASPSPLAE